MTQWLAQGGPQRVRIVELGPGRGTLLADVLRVSTSASEPLTARADLHLRQTFRSLPPDSRPPITSIHLVETSERLQGVQKQKLAETGFGETETHWYGDVKEIPECASSFVPI